MEMGSRVTITEDKHLLNQQCINLWGITGKDKKFWLRELTAAINCGKQSRDRGVTGGKLSRITKGTSGKNKRHA